MITIQTNAPEFKASVDQWIRHVELDIGASLDAGLQHAKEVARTLLELQTTQRTGNLMRGIETTQSSPFEGKLYDLETYAGYVEGGTVPHKIYPVRARYLRFVVGGMTKFVGPFPRYVQHPGTKARPYMWPAADSGAEWAGARLVRYLTT